ncbi:MAG: hypothetical protein JSW39_02435 [Desulfobacterales bacterium]|nr:MAG: hypothetical protein JSW39_02435 [Desulfobacterales bacterium]
MTEPAKKNPIEQRIDYLAGLWNKFAKDPEPRLLRWLVDDDGLRMVELLVEMQNEEVGDIPDLFIRFDVPFTNPHSYPLELLKSLVQQYEDSRKDIAAADLPTNLECPSMQPQESGVQTFARACVSLREYYQGKMLALVAFLTPNTIANATDWIDFLLRLVRVDFPPTIRITVIDHVDRPVLNALCQAEPTLVQTVIPDLDMPGALEEIAETAGGVGPGNDFRKLFVRLSNVVATGNTKPANKLAISALRIARKQKWFDLQAAVYMVLGAMYLGKQDASLALKAYQYADKAAAAAEKSGNPAGGKLVVQTRFARAGALISAGNYAEAAPLYEGTAPLTKAQNDAFLELEAWRMASYCYEMEKQPSKAWQCGQQALEAGERLDDNLRPNSTLPYVGQRLLGLLTQNKADPKYERQVRARMEALVGEGWEDKLVTGEAAS